MPTCSKIYPPQMIKIYLFAWMSENKHLNSKRQLSQNFRTYYFSLFFILGYLSCCNACGVFLYENEGRVKRHLPIGVWSDKKMIIVTSKCLTYLAIKRSGYSSFKALAGLATAALYDFALTTTQVRVSTNNIGRASKYHSS